MVRVTECVRLCAEIAEHVTELLNQILHTFDRILQSPIFRSETTATVNYQRIELRKKMIEILTRMNEGLIAACMSLTQYATNEEVYDAIRREVSQERIPRLKIFLQVCTKRCNTVMECCTECCDSTEAMSQIMGTLVTEYGKVMDGEQRRSILAKVAYGVGCSGLVACVALGVVTFAPVAVPAAISLGTAATASTTALVAGMASGKVLQQYKKDDVQAVEEALQDITKYQSLIKKLRSITLKCKGRTWRAVRDLKSYNVVAVGSSQSPDTVPLARYEVKEVDDERLMEFIRNGGNVSTVLKEFKRNMESLEQQTNVATTKIEEILDDL